MNSNKQVGQIELIFGPMFSGKSTELLRKIKRYEVIQYKCLVVNYAHDNRYSEDQIMSTHDKLMRTAMKCMKLSEIDNIYSNFDVIAIDQGQFFTDIVQKCEQMANAGKIVIVAGLDGTYQRKSFGNIVNLLPLAQKVTKLSAVCVQCHKDAFFTRRTVDNSQIELIGGQQIYKPVCRKCFFKSKEPEKTIMKNIQNIQNVEKTEKKHLKA